MMGTLQYLILILVAAGMFLVGSSEGRRKERAKHPEPILPFCPCEHLWSMHKDGKECLVDLPRKRYDKHGDFAGYDYAKCPCTVYHGPKVINDDFFHPGIADL